jgi:transcriptional regulator with XRE-family HTH domain
MQDPPGPKPSTGFGAIDRLLGGLRIGDNVVWRLHGASREPFAEAFLRGGVALPKLAYVSFDASAEEVLARYGSDWLPDRSVLLDCSAGPADDLPNKRLLGKRGLSVRHVADPSDASAVTAALTGIEHEFGTMTRYVFDSLTIVQKAWGREAALAVFLDHCPRLYHLRTVAYWFLDADEHDQSFLDRMTQLTQVVLDVEPSGGDLLVRVVKAQDRQVLDGKRVRVARAEGTAAVEDAGEGSREQRGETIRRLRVGQGMTQAHLARKVGITPSALSQAERGVTPLSDETLARVRQALGVGNGVDAPVRAPGHRVWRRGQRSRRQLAHGLHAEEMLGEAAGIEAHSLVFAPGASGRQAPFSTKRPEIVMVESGVLEIGLEDTTEVLHAGDSLLLEHESLSSWRNPGSSEARVLWMIPRP